MRSSLVKITVAMLVTLFSYCEGYNDPQCFDYSIPVSNNMQYLDFYANGVWQYAITSFYTRKNECYSNQYYLSLGGSYSGTDYVVYRFYWDVANCSGSLCKGSIQGYQCGITTPVCGNAIFLDESATIDANGDPATFTEIVSPTFRIVPFR